MLLPLGAGLLSSALLILLAARASPEWGDDKAARPAFFPVPGARIFLALAVFGLVVAIPAALGLVRGNVLLVLSGLVATMAGRRLLSGAAPTITPKEAATAKSTKQKKNRGAGVAAEAGPGAVGAGTSGARRATSGPANAYLWFVIFSWSIFAAAWWVGTFDLRQALAAQAVLGPAALMRGPFFSLLACLGFLAGLASAIFWIRTTPSIAPAAGAKAEAWLRRGEAALAGSALSAAFFGPSLGALTGGPSASDLRAGIAASLVLTCMVVTGISWSRRLRTVPSPRTVQLVSGAVALAAMTAGAFGR